MPETIKKDYQTNEMILINGQFDSLHKRIDDLNVRINDVHLFIRENSERIKSLEVKLDSKISSLEAKMDSNFNVINKSLNNTKHWAIGLIITIVLAFVGYIISIIK